MQFEYSEKVETLLRRLGGLLRGAHLSERSGGRRARLEAAKGKARWEPIPIVEQLKPKARAAGLWNMFLPHSERGAGLTNLEYAPLCEVMGRVSWSSEVFNCSAPDTGNMEILERYASDEVKARFLAPLLKGEIRSAFCMTEPAVASSDATNIETKIARDGDDYVITGRKWWSSGAGDVRCKVLIVMGKTDPARPGTRSSRRSSCRWTRRASRVAAHAAGVRLRRRAPRARRDRRSRTCASR